MSDITSPEIESEIKSVTMAVTTLTAETVAAPSQPSALQQLQMAAGATWQQFADGTVVVAEFGQHPTALQAIESGVVLCDRSHWGRILVGDSDRIRFLHNQSTNDFQTLKPGQGCDTVFVTSTARTLDLATAYVLDDAVMVVVSPNRRQFLLQWLDRYIFFADRVTLTDVTATTAMFTLMGTSSQAVLQQLAGVDITGVDISIAPYAAHQVVTIGGVSVRVAVGSGLTTPGYTLIMPADQAAVVWQILTGAGAVPMGDRLWQQLRIQQGRPVPDAELTEDYNPLEAGLWKAVSFSKGCYIGQETIARLDTYKGVKQRLWGIRFAVDATAELSVELNVEPGSVVMLGEEKVGRLTSLVSTDIGMLGLAYIRTKAGGSGLQVTVGNITGEVVDVAFLRHQYQDGSI